MDIFLRSFDQNNSERGICTMPEATGHIADRFIQS